MWTCHHCGTRLDDQFDSCWKCSSPKSPDLAAPTPAGERGRAPAAPWQLRYRVFRGTWATWEQLFSEAAQFATRIGPERILSISHSADSSDGVVTVWYWSQNNQDDHPA